MIFRKLLASAAAYGCMTMYIRVCICIYIYSIYIVVLLTKWFKSTRIETRNKNSNIFASSWVEKLACVMKVIIVLFVSVADRPSGINLSMRISVGAREMVNYACEG